MVFGFSAKWFLAFRLSGFWLFQNCPILMEVCELNQKWFLAFEGFCFPEFGFRYTFTIMFYIQNYVFFEENAQFCVENMYFIDFLGSDTPS